MNEENKINPETINPNSEQPSTSQTENQPVINAEDVYAEKPASDEIKASTEAQPDPKPSKYLEGISKQGNEEEKPSADPKPSKYLEGIVKQSDTSDQTKPSHKQSKKGMLLLFLGLIILIAAIGVSAAMMSGDNLLVLQLGVGLLAIMFSLVTVVLSKKISAQAKKHEEIKPKQKTMRTSMGAIGGALLVATVISVIAGSKLAPTIQYIAATPIDTIGVSAPFTVKFDANILSNGVNIFNWNFGDGEQGNGPIISHTYKQVGTFSATLSITEGGRTTYRESVPVIISNILPNIIVKTDKLDGEAPLTVSFDARQTTDPNGQILKYEWNFGDGTPAENGETLNQIEHTFQSNGVYSVSLKVTDNNLAVAEKTIEITTGVIGAPKAIINTNPNTPIAPAPFTIKLDALDSEPGNSKLVSYLWEFDDGSPSERGQTATHTFKRIGEYSVRLTLENEEGLRNSTILPIRATKKSEAPTAVISADKQTSGEVPFEISFSAQQSSDPEGAISKYIWDFGDESEQEFSEKVTHTFTQVGEYEVALTVVDSDGMKNTKIIKVNVSSASPKAPKVEVTTTPSPIVLTPGKSATFDAGASYDPDGRIVSYSWDFGDGLSSEFQTSPRVTHIYETVGFFTARVTAHDDSGLSTTRDIQVTVNTSATAAHIGASTLSGSAPLQIQFDSDRSEGDIASTKWDFGDGLTSERRNPTHVYARPGIYTVQLTINDATGNTSTTTEQIKVE